MIIVLLLPVVLGEDDSPGLPSEEEDGGDDGVDDGNLGNEKSIRFLSGRSTLVGGDGLLSSIIRVLLGLADLAESFGGDDDGPNGTRFGNGNRFCFFWGGLSVPGACG